MEFLSNKPLLITDTILRDAHQSQAATRMTLEQMLPACEILDSIGYYSLECWGGATFDACLRFLDEDPWERLRGIRNGQFTEGVICLLRKRGFQRRRAEIRCLLSRNIVGKRPRRARRQHQQHSQKHKQPLFHKHSPIMVKNVRISGSAA